MAHQRYVGLARVGKALAKVAYSTVLVWVRNGSSDWRKRWRNACAKLGLVAIPVQDNGVDGADAWERCYRVAATDASLTILTSGLPEYKVVVRWEYGCAPVAVMGERSTSIGPEKRPLPVRPAKRRLEATGPAPERPLPDHKRGDIVTPLEVTPEQEKLVVPSDKEAAERLYWQWVK